MRPLLAKALDLLAVLFFFLCGMVFLALLFPGAKAETPMEWFERTYPNQKGYCCTHEHCKPVEEWGRLVFTGKSWRLQKHDGSWYRGEVDADGPYAMHMPLTVSVTLACVYNGEFRCLLGESGQ